MSAKFQIAASLLLVTSAHIAAAAGNPEPGCTQFSFWDRIPADLASREAANVLSVCSISVGDGKVSAAAVVGFDAPPAGLLFMSDGEGSMIGDALRVGRPVSIAVRSLKSGRALLILQATVGTGTGVREDTFSIYKVDHAKPTLVWSGLAYRREFVDGRNGVTRKASVSIEDGNDDDSIDVDHVVIETRESANKPGAAKPIIHLDRKHISLR